MPADARDVITDSISQTATRLGVTERTATDRYMTDQHLRALVAALAQANAETLDGARQDLAGLAASPLGGEVFADEFGLQARVRLTPSASGHHAQRQQPAPLASRFHAAVQSAA